MTERVTRALLRDVPLAGVGTLALLTLDNGEGPRVPNTFGPLGIAELTAALERVRDRAESGEIVAVAITGKPFHFAAGADLHQAAALAGSRESAAAIARAGHDAYRILLELPVPSFAYVSGVALGGGLELALSCRYRTVSSQVRDIGLPEVSLGLVPGWGGTYLLPRLVGIETAIEVILTNPLRQNRRLTAARATDMGIMDRCLEPADFLVESIRWTAAVLRGEETVTRTDHTEPTESTDPIGAGWAEAVRAAGEQVRARLAGASPAATRAVDLLALASRGDREASYAAEEEALTDLLTSPEFAASMHAFDLTTRRARSPLGAPPAELARPVRRVGVIGAGLMASQLALLFARRLQVPVVMRDLDADRAARGVGYVAAEVRALVDKGRLSEAQGRRITSLVSGTTDPADLAGADLVIEAVFEELEVKKAVFAEIEPFLDPTAVLATNTSALSVSAMSGQLAHPERVVGLHFFNPVAQMPLVEVVRTPSTDDAAYATAFAVARGCRKTAVAVADRPGFVVNRLLVRLLGEVLGSLEEGTSVADADAALRPLGLPMGPFQLLQLVGPAVAMHVLETLHADLGPRFPASPGLARMVAEGAPFVRFEGRPSATSPVDPEIARFFGSRAGTGQAPAELLRRVRDALAEEVGLMLADVVAGDGDDIDLAMILGAGWPFHLGGIIPYLERTAG
ncbi:3-hydroxyacyl-CoA dehydrogenase NAD-binding domain-containing protein [Pseudactinotalea sp. HY158]|uniref:3-hydroxyacyl-CoA dehydrogenase NAD-binding domain-containing protein n=1 Tax=Pseudactinotalea sp. HY158 TaxID=2654547 RepID=UPI00129C377F|nr:3-hydroxyacyl-CoA dehydrogenase NAD-binding domain-containing protein [Pseudactinotalea sp. HY158]QGH69307.1 3-hydroxyacyl-CoA dehydrogenase [Pseudactinotalea sp. HY158]